MAITYSWAITSLESYPQSEGQSDVVFVIHWQRLAADGAYSASVNNSTDVTYTAGAPFTPYANLTEAQVIGWIEAAMGVDRITAMDEALSQKITEQATPAVVILPLPWVS